jgi:hypothetical protein
MTIGGLFAVLTAFFQFPAELTAFIKLLQQTPDEKKAAIVGAIESQLQSFQDTGRPS